MPTAPASCCTCWSTPARPPTRHGRRTTTSAPVDLAAVARVYDLHLLTPSLVAALNPERALEELLPEQREIGYPSQ
jgi:hypothetical protein